MWFMGRADESDTKVKHCDYDLSNGWVRTLTGGGVEAVHHSSIIAFNEEYSYGPDGIIVSLRPRERPKSTRADKVAYIGKTFRSFLEFQNFIEKLRNNDFKGSNYDVLEHNCNTFAQVLSKFLCNKSIPKHVLNLQKNVSKNIDDIMDVHPLDPDALPRKAIGGAARGLTYMASSSSRSCHRFLSP